MQAATIERLGGYRIVRRLARGETSEVLLASEEGPFGFQRDVVLKLLLPRFKHDDQMRRLFSREAAAYGRLRDPGIVKLLDFSVFDGQLVMVLEYIDGAPLSRVSPMLKNLGEGLDDRAAIHIAERLFTALAAAHAAKDEAGKPAALLHRNVSPSNVLIAWDGAVKLSDLGVARVVGASPASIVGLPKGTDGYMAPELLAGESLTVKTDVYCAALILWELLTGKRAFPPGTQPRAVRPVADAKTLGEPARLEPLDKLRNNVDKRVCELVREALEPNPADRKRDAEQIASALREIVSPEDGRDQLTRVMTIVRNGAASSVRTPASIASLDDPSVQFQESPLSLSLHHGSHERLVAARPPPKPYKPASLPKMPAVSVTGKGSTPKLPAVRTTPQPMAAVVPPRIATPPPIPAVVTPRIPTPPPIPAVVTPKVPTPKPMAAVVPPVEAPAVGVPTRASPSSFPAFEKRLVLDYAALNAPKPAPDSSEASTIPDAAPVIDALAKTATAEAVPLDVVARVDAPVPATSTQLTDVTKPSPVVVAPPPRRRSSFVLFGSLLSVAGILFASYRIFASNRAAVARDRARLEELAQSAKASTERAPAPSSEPAEPRSLDTKPAETKPVDTKPAETKPVDAPPAAAVPAPSPASSAVASAPEGMTWLRTSAAAPGHRIFVDERPVAQTPSSTLVKCGSHFVKLGSSGKVQQLDLPCGGEIDVGDR